MINKHFPSLDDLAALNAELAALVRARIPMEASLRRLGRQLPKRAGALSNRLAQRMERGASLAEAIEEEGKALPEMYKAVVVAGLASDQPAAGLETVARSAARLASLRQTAGISLIMPVMVVCLASFLFGLMFSQLLRDGYWIAPESVGRVYVWSQSAAFRRLFLWGLPLVAIVVPLAWWFRTRTARSITSSAWTVFGWIPGARKLHRLSASATFAEVLRIAIVAGLPWGSALRSAGRAAGHRRYLVAANRLAMAVEQGESLTDNDNREIAKALDELPALVKIAIEQGGHRGLLEAAIDRAAQSYLQRAEALHASLVGWIPAMLTLGVAGSVTAAYALAFVWPYAQMLTTLAGDAWK